MRSIWVRGVVGMVVMIGTATAWAGAPRNTVGTPISDFTLVDTLGATRSLSEFASKGIVVVVFIGAECPVTNAQIPALNAIHQRHGRGNVQVLAINSNPNDSPSAVSAHGRDHRIEFPILRDAGQEVLEMFGAESTPQAYILDKDRVVRYAGLIAKTNDDAGAKEYLQDALTELVLGRRISVAFTAAQGSPIPRGKGEAAAHASVTYAGDIARILQDNCVQCHRPGGIGPMALTSFDRVRSFGPMILETIQDGRMPPWHADPAHGTFSNERRLTQEQIDTITAWVHSGMPEGDRAALPPQPKFAENWRIGTPDIVFEMPEIAMIPASGTVPYLYFETPTNFKEDRWVSAVEAQPGNSSVVHHILVYMKDPSSAWTPRDATLDLGAGMLGGFAPGDEPRVYPKDVAVKVPAGSTLIWQMHYTPTGRAESDRSRIALQFAKEPPVYEYKEATTRNMNFRIPAGAADHKVESTFVFPANAKLLSMMPHMHLRGKAFTVDAIYPDGKSETLLRVPRFDFSWQTTYFLAEPKVMPQGTRLHCTAWFDNSPHNPANPDPTRDVYWGDQTWEEMMIGWFGIVWDEPIQTASARSR